MRRGERRGKGWKGSVFEVRVGATVSDVCVMKGGVQESVGVAASECAVGAVRIASAPLT